jgi:ubiquitin C-terminal hydrolase
LHEAFLQLAETREGRRQGDAKALKTTMDKLGNRFRGNSQQDAHEFLSDFIDYLAEEYEQKQERKESVIGENGQEVKDRREEQREEATAKHKM